ncbi:hypothetical protein A0257_15255 [Hymenobacter psoromatis]|nr:hypothetical protein A0257_15255 [Hymenobacter psoromatis]
MSAAGKKNNTFLYFLLLVLAIWLGWKVLLITYYALSYAGLNTMLALDLSAFGRLSASHWPGYAGLGAGLGAAGGAIAARRRFGLGRPVEVLGWIAIVLLLGLIYATTEVETAAENTTTVVEGPTAPATTVSPTPPAPAEVREQPIVKYAPAPDTSSTAAEGWQQIVVRVAPLRASWVDSSAKPFAYLHAGDTVQLVRRAHAWAQVANSLAGSGWVRRASLGPLAEEDEPAPAEEQALTPPAQPRATLAKASTQAKPAVRPDTAAPAITAARPVGHQQCSGTVDNLAVKYSLDFQKTGVLSGYYYYQQQPGKVYRLTGSLAPSGELQLLEFTRGRQSARCVLQRQGNDYAGTKYAIVGGQVPMTLTLD